MSLPPPADAQSPPIAPALLNTNGNSDLGDDHRPQAATDGAGNWVMVWDSNTDLAGTAGTDFDIFVATSSDSGATWTAPTLLNTNGETDSGNDIRPQIATDGGGNWLVAWQSAENLSGPGAETAGSDEDLFFAMSGDNGANWSAPSVLNTNAYTDAGDDSGTPEIVMPAVGDWMVVWESDENLDGTAGFDPDLFVTSSFDQGASWQPPVLFNSNGNSDVGTDIRPQIAASSSGNWVAVWVSGEDLGGTAGTDLDIFVSTSADFGVNWATPAPLNTNATSDTGEDNRPSVAVDDFGNWVAVWDSQEDLNGTAGTDIDLFVAKSSDNGGTWTVPVLLNTNGNSDVGSFDTPSDYGAQITADVDGNWVAVWVGDYDLAGISGSTDSDIFVAMSGNSGATWTSPSQLSTNGASDSDADFFPGIFYQHVGGEGSWMSVWASREDLSGTAGGDYDVFFGTSNDIDGDGTPDSSDFFPVDPSEVADTDGDGTGNNADTDDDNDTWLDAQENQAGTDPLDRFSHPQPNFSSPALLNTNGTSDSSTDWYPQMSTDRSGNWIAVWASFEDLDGLAGPDRDILVARSSDNGGSWSAPTLLNSNGTGDLGSDDLPQLATDEAGNWVAVWRSDEDLAGAGSDEDIFVATSTNGGLTWTAPAVLNNNGNTDSGADGNPRIATNGTGRWIVVWDSTENLAGTAQADADIFVATSADNGASWSVPALLNSNGTTDAGDDTWPEIASDSAGNWVVIWESDENLAGAAQTDADILVSTSSDDGGSWSAPALLNSNGNTDSGADSFASIATDGAGTWISTWVSQETLFGMIHVPGNIFVASSTDNGSTWTPPALVNGSLQGGSTWPQITTDSVGNWIVVWHARFVTTYYFASPSNDQDVFLSSSSDNGVSWTFPSLLNANGVGDLGNDNSAMLATDEMGQWVALWRSSENLNGTAGTDLDIFYATTDDIDGDEVPDVSDAFPLDPLESADTDGDGTGNNTDLDDDGDGIEDVWESNSGIYVGPGNTGTNPLNPDTDGDGILDGDDFSPLDSADCRSQNPQLKLVWGRDAPFGIDHQNDPGIGHQYLMNANTTLPGLASDDARLPAGLPASLASGLQALFDDARADYPALPATENGLQISTLTAADPLPAQGTPGSPSLLYIIDRSALTDPDFGPLEGFALDGVNRFNKRCTGEAASVFIDADAVPPTTDPGYPEYLADLVESVGHEAGHLYGLRHVLPDGLGACVGDPAVPGGSPAVMDYYPDGSAAELANCTGTPGQGCPVTEPPDCTGEDTGEDHNPLFHYLHHVVGDSTLDLAAVGIVPGAWDAEAVPLVTWLVEFGFLCGTCNDPNRPFYNLTLTEVLPGDIEVVRAVFSEITLAEINGDPFAVPPIPPLTVLIAQSSGLRLTASSIDPTVAGPDAPMDITLGATLYSPASQDDPSGTLVGPNLVQVVETSPGEFETELLATTTVETTPVYLMRTGGVADPPDGVYEIPTDGSPVGVEDQLTSSTYSCPECFPAMTVTDVADTATQAVPEPGFGAGLAAGLAGLIALMRRRRG
ncbi:MAG: sialidase family protein [Myxococcota bacterium]|nr:sialidase family protein [Myxococcota bacterium]